MAIRTRRSAVITAFLTLSLCACAGKAPEASKEAQQQATIAAMLDKAPPEDEAVKAMPLEERASHYLAARDNLRLRQTLDTYKTSEDLNHSLDWSKRNLMNGETIFISYPYAGNLWKVGSSVPVSDPRVKYKETAAMIVAYAFAVILVDGQKCKDQTAPGHWMEKNILDWHDSTWAFLTSLSPQQRESLLSLAVDLEKYTSALRKDDYFICSGGVEAQRHADYSKAYEIPTPAGGVGRTLMVPDDPDYVPEFRAAAEYLPKQQQIRQQLLPTLRIVAGNPRAQIPAVK